MTVETGPVQRPDSDAHRSGLGLAVGLSAEVIGLLTQTLLVIIGIEYLAVDDGEETESARLFLWCLIGTAYLAATVLWLNFDLRLRRGEHPLLLRIIGFAPLRWFSTLVTFSSSLVGLSAAVTLIVMRSDPDHLAIYELAAIWAMLLSWALFHWGYARIYHSRAARAGDDPPLRFPGTPHPRQVDFVYFAFTNGTSFAASDVAVCSTRMRWTVVWHTTFSFFFNALIIVLTMNTIAGGLTGL